MREFFSNNWIPLAIISGAIVLWVIGSIFLYKQFFKRLYDIIFAIIGLPFFISLFMPIALLIKLSDKGSVFYMGERLGRRGKNFRMFKFRSMGVNAPDIRLEDGSTYNSDDDPRVTKIGKFLRKTSLDETPQILNILLGHMSFIGPRPDLPDSIDKLTEEEKRKLRIRPGVTGYSQAVVRNSVEWKERLRYDCFYADKVSAFFDVKILFLTVVTVLFKKNLYSANLGKKIDETTLTNLGDQDMLIGITEDEAIDIDVQSSIIEGDIESRVDTQEIQDEPPPSICMEKVVIEDN